MDVTALEEQVDDTTGTAGRPANTTDTDERAEREEHDVASIRCHRRVRRDGHLTQTVDRDDDRPRGCLRRRLPQRVTRPPPLITKDRRTGMFFLLQPAATKGGGEAAPCPSAREMD